MAFYGQVTLKAHISVTGGRKWPNNSLFPSSYQAEQDAKRISEIGRAVFENTLEKFGGVNFGLGYRGSRFARAQQCQLDTVQQQTIGVCESNWDEQLVMNRSSQWLTTSKGVAIFGIASSALSHPLNASKSMDNANCHISHHDDLKY